MLKKILSLYVAISFLGTLILPGYAQAQELRLPAPNEFVHLSNPYSFPVIKGLKFDPSRPFDMEFILDTADAKKVSQEEAGQLVRYFLAGLTVPEEDLWVNLGPQAQDRITSNSLSQTDLGKDLLSQDYLLKQISCSLTYPENSTGKDFWTRVYDKVYRLTGSSKVAVNTFNRVWIVPDEALVYENQDTAWVGKASLKAMLEEDFLALKNKTADIQKEDKKLDSGMIEKINQASSGLMRSLILPKISREINAGENFATLRQIYHSLILAAWFKKKFQNSLYQHYINKAKVAGIDLSDKGAKEKIYNLYVEALNKGLYNYVKTERAPDLNKPIKRRYFSGGTAMTALFKEGGISYQAEPAGSSVIEAHLSELAGPGMKLHIETKPVEPQSAQAGQPTASSAVVEEAKEASQTTGPTHASWQEFEEKELAGKEFDQHLRHLSRPQKLAFNIDAFTNDSRVGLFRGLERVFDSMFRLLDGNPNFAPAVIFLGEKASKKSLAQFLKSNTNLGNAKYKIELKGQNLFINGTKIRLEYGLATAERLKELQSKGMEVDFLVEATRQRYLESIGDKEDVRSRKKQKEEEKQFSRLQNYTEALPNLKVIVISPEEDMGPALGKSLVNRVNSVGMSGFDSRIMVMATPVTTAAGIMASVVEGLVKEKNNSKATVRVAVVRAERTDRQGNRLIDTPAIRPGLAINQVLGKTDADFGQGSLSDEGVQSGANHVTVTLRVDGSLPELSEEEINQAFQEAAKESLRGVIDFKGEATVSSFERFNEHPLVFTPQTTKISRVNQANGAPYRTVTVNAWFSEFGYAKNILDFMTGISLFEGDKASTEESVALAPPQGTIPATQEKIRLQVVKDGQSFALVMNGMGRMGKDMFRRTWREPNTGWVGFNGLAMDIAKTAAILMEHDAIYGEAPYEIAVTQDKKALIFTDKQEQIVLANERTLLYGPEEKEKGQAVMRTPYGNLSMEIKDGQITRMKLHGQEVIKIRNNKNANDTWTIQGQLRNGTSVRVIYQRAQENSPEVSFILTGVKKKITVPFANIRQDESVYKRQPEDKTDVDFLARVERENRRLAMKILLEFDLNEKTIFLDGSDKLTEKTKLWPFVGPYDAAAIISGPSKEDISKIIKEKAVDATIVPGVNLEDFLLAWSKRIYSCASCTTNAAATAMKAMLTFLYVVAANFDTVHARTAKQGPQFGRPGKDIKDSVPSGETAFVGTSGASNETTKVLPVLAGLLNGKALRVGNDDGSLLYLDLQVEPKDGDLPTAVDINALVKEITETPAKKGGLKGFLGFGEYNNSLEVVGKEFGGIFDPSKTRVNQETRTVTIGVWYDNEGGFINQYFILALLAGLQQEALDRKIEIIAQDAVVEPGAHTGRISVESVKQNADGMVAGLGQVRILEERANRRRKKPVNIDGAVNQALKKALELGIDLPIFNLYVSRDDIEEGRIAVSLHDQISDGLKGLAPEDIIRLAVSLETAKDSKLPLKDYARKVRDEIAKTVADAFTQKAKEEKTAYLEKFGQKGYEDHIAELKKVAGGSAEDEIFKNYANLTGSKVASKVRVIVKLNDAVENPQEIKDLAGQIGVDGIILPAPLEAWPNLKSLAQEINAHIAENTDKQADLNKRISPRFFLGFNLGASLMDAAVLPEDYFGVNPYWMQMAILPPAIQLRELYGVQRGEKPLTGKAPQADKKPVRTMLQAVSVDHKEGSVNLLDAVEHFQPDDILIAHSEQLEFRGLTDEQINGQVVAAHALRRLGKISGAVIVAVGEDKNDSESQNIVEQQVLNRLAGLDAKDLEKGEFFIAYEPRWAIGTNLTPTAKEIQAMHRKIRTVIEKKWGLPAAQKIKILYGGSFNHIKKDLDLKETDPAKKRSDAEVILGLEDVDGALIGTASATPQDLLKIAQIAEKVSDEKYGENNFPRKQIELRGNHKAFTIKHSYDEFVKALSDIDRRKVAVGLGPQMSRFSELAEVYQKDPLKGIVFIDQLTREEKENKAWFIRADLNVPINDIKAKKDDSRTWEVTSEARIDAIIPDVQEVVNNDGIAVLVTHFEPKGKNLNGPQYSVRFLVPYLERKLGKKVTFVSDILGPGKDNALKNAKPGSVILLENVRKDENIRKQEKADKDTPEDIAARDQLASQLYSVPDGVEVGGIISAGFGVMHRNAATTAGKAKNKRADRLVARVGGKALREELVSITTAIREAQGPQMLVLGGGPKIGDKVETVKNFILTAEEDSEIFLVGGAAVLFALAQDSSFQAGLSKGLADGKTLAQAKEIWDLAKGRGIKITLPADWVTAEELPRHEDEQVSVRKDVAFNEVMSNEGVYDIGEKTVHLFEEKVLDTNGKSKFAVIIWNGPAGVFEFEQFLEGTQGIANVMVKATKSQENPEGAITILGGGETAAAAELTGVADKVTIVSKGGGATLELLAGKEMPGVEASRYAAVEYSYHLDPAQEADAQKILTTISDYAEANAASPLAAAPQDTASSAVNNLQETKRFLEDLKVVGTDKAEFGDMWHKHIINVEIIDSPDDIKLKGEKMNYELESSRPDRQFLVHNHRFYALKDESWTAPRKLLEFVLGKLSPIYQQSKTAPFYIQRIQEELDKLRKEETERLYREESGGASEAKKLEAFLHKLDLAARSNPPASSPDRQSAQASSAVKTILYIEHDFNSAQWTSRKLKKAGFSVTETIGLGDFEAALVHIGAVSQEIVSRIRRANPKAHIIVYKSGYERAVLPQGLTGADYYFVITGDNTINDIGNILADELSGRSSLRYGYAWKIIRTASSSPIDNDDEWQKRQRKERLDSERRARALDGDLDLLGEGLEKYLTPEEREDREKQRARDHGIDYAEWRKGKRSASSALTDQQKEALKDFDKLTQELKSLISRFASSFKAAQPDMLYLDHGPGSYDTSSKEKLAAVNRAAMRVSDQADNMRKIRQEIKAKIPNLLKTAQAVITLDTSLRDHIQTALTELQKNGSQAASAWVLQEWGGNFDKDLKNLVSAASSSPVEAKPGEAKSAPQAETLTVLVVDDNDGLRKTLATRVKLEGVEVEVAENGAQGLEKLKEMKDKGLEPFVVSDLQMPGMDGLDFISAALAQGLVDERNVVLHSGIGINEIKEEANRRGDAFIKIVNAITLMNKGKDKFEKIATPLKAAQARLTSQQAKAVSSALKPEPAYGGISLEGIKVDAAASSAPLNIPFDLANFAGFSFRIVRMEPLAPPAKNIRLAKETQAV